MKRTFIVFFGMAVIAGLIAPGSSNAQSPAATGGTRSHLTMPVKPETVSSTPGNPASNQPGKVPEVSPSRRPCIYIEQNLGYGARDRVTNNSVTNYQTFLKLHGYLKVEPTGYFGPLTLAATKAFQRDSGIITTGFVGRLTRAQMKVMSCADDKPASPAVKGISVSVTTDKSTYAQDENIVIKITAKNTTAESKTLHWNTGCQTSYMIDRVYNSEATMLCTKALTSRTLAAGESYTWTMNHNTADHVLTPGSHTITGGVIGYGSAVATIQVTQ